MLANLQTTMVPFRNQNYNTVKKMYQENEIADLEDFTTFRANIYKTVKLQARACLKNCWLKQNWLILALFVSCFSSDLEQQFERLWSTLIVKQMIFHWRCWAFEWQCWHKSANHLKIKAGHSKYTKYTSISTIYKVLPFSNEKAFMNCCQ